MAQLQLRIRPRAGRSCTTASTGRPRMVRPCMLTAGIRTSTSSSSPPSKHALFDMMWTEHVDTLANYHVAIACKGGPIGSYSSGQCHTVPSSSSIMRSYHRQHSCRRRRRACALEAVRLQRRVSSRRTVVRRRLPRVSQSACSLLLARCCFKCPYVLSEGDG